MVICVTLFILAFFVFNKWSIQNDKPVRTFEFTRKNTESKVMTINFKFKKINSADLYNTKEEAEASKLYWREYYLF